MKYILLSLILMSLSGLGQGLAVTVYIPGQGWVSKNIYDTNNPPTSITNPTLTNPTLAGIITLPAAAIAWSKLVGSDIVLPESQITNLSTDLAAKQGISVGATTATTGTMTTTMTAAQNVFTITPTAACTFNASGGTAGARTLFVITTSGTSTFTLTWGTNFKPVSTLATGTTSGKIFTIDFVCTNGVQWVETGRTAAH